MTKVSALMNTNSDTLKQFMRKSRDLSAALAKNVLHQIVI